MSRGRVTAMPDRTSVMLSRGSLGDENDCTGGTHAEAPGAPTVPARARGGIAGAAKGSALPVNGSADAKGSPPA